MIASVWWIVRKIRIVQLACVNNRIGNNEFFGYFDGALRLTLRIGLG